MTAAHRLSWLLVGLMAAQSLAGLAVPTLYRDVGYVLETWFGNDLVTLVLAVPLLVLALRLERRGRAAGRLLWLGLLGYGLYNGAFYLFGAALNALFPVYVATLLVAGIALVLALVGTDVAGLAAHFGTDRRLRIVAAYLVAVAAGLTVVWLEAWAAHVFAGRPTPGEPDAFRLVAALDLVLMVPALAAGGVLLWRRHRWGPPIAAIAAIQCALYLVVLASNAARFVARGLVEPPGELPMWAGLALATGLAAAVLLERAHRRDA